MKNISKTSLFALAAVLVVSMAVASVVLPNAFAARNSGVSNSSGDNNGNGNSGGVNVLQVNNGSSGKSDGNGNSGGVNVLQVNNGSSGTNISSYGIRLFNFGNTGCNSDNRC